LPNLKYSLDKFLVAVSYIFLTVGQIFSLFILTLKMLSGNKRVETAKLWIKNVNFHECMTVFGPCLISLPK